MVNEVHISYMTPEELAADRERRAKERAKYPWWRDRQAAQQLIDHNMTTRRKLKKTYKRRK